MKKILKYCFLLVISFLSFFSTIDGNSTTPSDGEEGGAICVNEDGTDTFLPHNVTPRSVDTADNRIMPACLNEGSCVILCSYKGENTTILTYLNYGTGESNEEYSVPMVYDSQSGRSYCFSHMDGYVRENAIRGGQCHPNVTIEKRTDTGLKLCFKYDGQGDVSCNEDGTKIKLTEQVLNNWIGQFGEEFKIKYNGTDLPADQETFDELDTNIKDDLCEAYLAKFTAQTDPYSDEWTPANERISFIDELFITQFKETFNIQHNPYLIYQDETWIQEFAPYANMKKNLIDYLNNLEQKIIDYCASKGTNEEEWNTIRNDQNNQAPGKIYDQALDESNAEKPIPDYDEPKDPSYSVNVDTNVGTCQDYIGIVSVEGSPAYYIDYVYDVVKILVTVGLVLLSMFDIVKAITSEKNINSVYTKIAYRLAIVIMVLLLPTLISLVGELFTDKDILCGIR